MLFVADNVQLAMRIPYDIIKDAYDNEVMLLKSFDYTYDVKNGAQYHLKNLYNGDKILSKYLDVLHRY